MPMADILLEISSNVKGNKTNKTDFLQRKIQQSKIQWAAVIISQDASQQQSTF
jgi:hypothetical protein